MYLNGSAGSMKCSICDGPNFCFVALARVITSFAASVSVQKNSCDWHHPIWRAEAKKILVCYPSLSGITYEKFHFWSSGNFILQNPSDKSILLKSTGVAAGASNKYSNRRGKIFPSCLTAFSGAKPIDDFFDHLLHYFLGLTATPSGSSSINRKR